MRSDIGILPPFSYLCVGEAVAAPHVSASGRGDKDLDCTSVEAYSDRELGMDRAIARRDFRSTKRPGRWRS